MGLGDVILIPADTGLLYFRLYEANSPLLSAVVFNLRVARAGSDNARHYHAAAGGDSGLSGVGDCCAVSVHGQDWKIRASSF